MAPRHGKCVVECRMQHLPVIQQGSSESVSTALSKMVGLRIGLLLAVAIAFTPSVLSGSLYPASSPTACQGGGCDPSTHQIDAAAVHYQDDDGSQQSDACTSFLISLASRDDCTQWYSLIKRFNSSLGGADQLRATFLIPSDKALNTFLASLNYDWQGFFQLDDARLLFILQYLIIPVTATQPLIYTSNVTWNTGPAATMLAPNTLTFKPNKWRTFQVSDSSNSADVMPQCADQKTCYAVFHVIDSLLLPFPLPPRPAASKGCMTMYDYISTRGDLQHFKAAVDAAAQFGGGITIASLMQNPTFPATWFIVTDQVMDTWVKLYSNQPLKVAMGPYVHFEDLPATQIAIMLLGWFVRGQYAAQDLTSGMMLKRLTNDFLLVSRDEGRIRMWSTETSGVITQPDTRLCAAIVHQVHYPLIPFNSDPIDPFHYDFVNYPDGAPELLLVPRPGSWDTLGDLVCTSPHLSGFRDLIKGTTLEPLMNDPKMLSTWYIPTNKALLQWAGLTQVDTNALMSNIQKRINFLNYCVVPYSTLLSTNLANKQQLLTAYSPHYLTITMDAGYSVLGEGEKYLPYGAPVAVPDIPVGKGVCNVLDYNVAYAAEY